MTSSIIIYTHNNEDNIFNVVVTNCRRYPEHEIIVIDDNSDDNTPTLLDELSEEYDFIHLRFNRKIGVGSAISEGIINATKEIVVLIDSRYAYIRQEYFERALLEISRYECEIVDFLPLNDSFKYNASPFSGTFRAKAILKDTIVPLIQELIGINNNLDFFLDLYFRLKRRRILYLSIGYTDLTGSELKNNDLETDDKKEFRTILLELFLADCDLIIKRLKNLFINRNEYNPVVINSVQTEINRRLEEITNVF